MTHFSLKISTFQKCTFCCISEHDVIIFALRLLMSVPGRTSLDTMITLLRIVTLETAVKKIVLYILFPTKQKY